MFLHHAQVFKQNAVLEVCKISLPVSSKDWEESSSSTLLAHGDVGINGVNEPLTKVKKPQLASADE